jgi:hypothetical protein
MGEEPNICGDLVGRRLEERDVDGKIIVKRVLNMAEWCGLDSSALVLRPVTGCCEYDNEPSGSTMFW